MSMTQKEMMMNDRACGIGQGSPKPVLLPKTKTVSLLIPFNESERGNTWLANDGGDHAAWIRLNDKQFLEITITPDNYPGLQVSIKETSEKKLVRHINKNLKGWFVRKCNVTGVKIDENGQKMKNRLRKTLKTVNVIEMSEGSILGLVSFPDNSAGNKAAEKRFRQVAHENKPVPEPHEVYKALRELDNAVEDGHIEQGAWELFLVHSQNG